MSKQDDTAIINQQHWEKMVKEGCGFTRPWLNLNRETILQYARGQLTCVPESLEVIYPYSLLADVEGKDVLCLASGGGQQTAVFGLLGARVTVVDLAEGQLESDREAAAHYGYPITTIHADMRDLSSLGEHAFDLVYQANSMGYVPDVRQVYSEVARVLRTGGLYRVDGCNPVAQFVDETWDGTGYHITIPYAQRIQRRKGGPVEYRHYLSDIFNGLLDTGFSLQQVYESPCHLKHDADVRPGSWEHILMYIPWDFAIVAKKAQTTCD
jgi:ubiquinone/menaquinone biosynthesis C-methylase UbiE